MEKKVLSYYPLPIIGWREYLTLPELGVDLIKAKVDTGARSSAIHATDVEIVEQSGQKIVRFQLYSQHQSETDTIIAEAELFDQREVRNSGGISQLRPVIKTIVKLGSQSWPIELTLTNRDLMGFPMLLGREAVRRRFLVDAGGSFLQSQAHNS